MNTVEFLVDLANKHCEGISRNGFFMALEAGELDHLQWVWQLLYHSDHFCRSLSVRSGLCEDEVFKDVFAEHDHAEVKHPRQLKTWMAKEGFEVQLVTKPIIPTPETQRCADFCKKIAMLADSKVQLFVLNVLAERMARLFYESAGKVLKRLGKQHGPYWHIHEEVDDVHAAMGLDLLGELTSEEVMMITHFLNQGAHHFDDMIESWTHAKRPLRSTK